MPLNVGRLRRWFAGAAVFLLMVVAGAYYYGRMRIHRAAENLQKKLGINIQQSTEGFSLSQSVGGHTLFTVHASHAVQYQEGGRAELHDVNIVVYGRQSSRFDQIYGSDFLFDPKTGDVTAKGEVHIDLEGNAEGAVRPDLSPPAELKNPIHLKTSGLVFNQKTGVAQTKELVEFRVPQASGSAMGAIYDSKAASLTLQSDIRIHANGPNQSDVTARHGVIVKGPDRAILEGVRAQRSTGEFSADALTVYFRDDNTVERLIAVGNVKTDARGKSAFSASAPRAEAAFAQDNNVRSASLSGGVNWNSSGQDNMTGSSNRVLFAFAGGNRLQRVTAVDDVKLVQKPASTSPQGRTVQIAASSVDFDLHNGRTLQEAVTAGPAEVQVLSPDPKSGPIVATAGHFEAFFDSHSRLNRVLGYPQAKVVTRTPGQPEKVSTSNRLDVAFDAAGAVSALLQEGDFHFLDPGSAGQDREAWAQRARFTPSDDMLVLSGAPRVQQAGLTTSAQNIRINRRTGDAFADGDVKSTYSDLKPQPGGALLATADPIHVTAFSMTAHRTGADAIYTGEARLWQGSNILQAPTIDFNRDARTVIAQSTSAAPVTTVFVAQDKNGRQTPTTVSAAKLTYQDSSRQAHFEGGVLLKGGEMTVTAEQMDVYLLARASGQGNSVSGPSQLDHVIATRNVVIEEPKRRATGQKLVYTAQDQKFVLTGGPPSIFDAEHGKTTGDSLTFFTRDDRVLVEGRNSPTVTETRVIK